MHIWWELEKQETIESYIKVSEKEKEDKMAHITTGKGYWHVMG